VEVWLQALITGAIIKSEVKWNGEKFFRAVKGFTFLEISCRSVLCLVMWCDVKWNITTGNANA
jgi:hypothetical protein